MFVNVGEVSRVIYVLITEHVGLWAQGGRGRNAKGDIWGVLYILGVRFVQFADAKKGDFGSISGVLYILGGLFVQFR